MVWFQCEDCGDTIKKPKLDSHFRQCRASRLSCIDCLAVFDRYTVKQHTSCVTEHEKYAEGATKPGGYAAAGFTSAGGSGTAGFGNTTDAVGLDQCSSRPPWKCFLCNVNCTSKENLLAHAASKKHRNKYKRFVSNQEGNKEEEAAKKQEETTTVQQENSSFDKGEKDESKDSQEGKLGDTLKRELDAWDKHTKKIMKKKGGRLNLKKLSKLVTKRIVKKSQVGKCSSNQREKIQTTWKKKLMKSSHFLVEGGDVLLKKVF